MGCKKNKHIKLANGYTEAQLERCSNRGPATGHKIGGG